jgi:alpha-mannosidase
VGGHYAAYNLSSVLDRDRVSDSDHVQMTLWSAPGLSKPDFHEAKLFLSGGTPFRKGDKLGPSWTNHWIHVRLVIPESFRRGQEAVICEQSLRRTLG